MKRSMRPARNPADYGYPSTDIQALSAKAAEVTRRLLAEGDMNAIFQSGLHEFITGFIADNNKLGAAISEQYLN